MKDGGWIFWALGGVGLFLKYVVEATDTTMLIFAGFVCFAILAYWQERYHKQQMATLEKILDRLHGHQD